MFTITDVSKAYGPKKLFENVNVSFSPGRRYGLTGPNGAGKTTFFNCITGFVGGDDSLEDKSDLPQYASRCLIRTGNLAVDFLNQSGSEGLMDEKLYSGGRVASTTACWRNAVPPLDSAF